MIKFIDPSYRLMDIAGSLGIGPADFLILCATQNKGEYVIEKMFETKLGPEWYEHIIDKAKNEIEQTVIFTSSSRNKKRWYNKTMDSEHRKFTVHKYIHWAAAHFYDPAMPSVEEVLNIN